MKFISRTGVGFLVSIICLLIVTGDIQVAVLIVFASIVCTAGIGLVVWIPLWWVVGTISFAIVELLSPQTGEQAASDSDNAPASTDGPSSAQESLLHYLRKASEQGCTPQEVTKSLIDHGWTLVEIETAMQSLSASQPGT